MSATEVATAFIQHYYTQRDSNIDALLNLYQPQSSMTFEGTQTQGNQAIIDKLKSFGPVKHAVKSTDVQMGNDSNCLLIFVTGSVNIDTNPPLHYCQFFQLVSTGPGAYYVHNDIFRLNYGL